MKSKEIEDFAWKNCICGEGREWAWANCPSGTMAEAWAKAPYEYLTYLIHLPGVLSSGEMEAVHKWWADRVADDPASTAAASSAEAYLRGEKTYEEMQGWQRICPQDNWDACADFLRNRFQPFGKFQETT